MYMHMYMYMYMYGDFKGDSMEFNGDFMGI